MLMKTATVLIHIAAISVMSVAMIARMDTTIRTSHGHVPGLLR